jgi:DNA-binding CsgD family transcriptional regulator
MKSRDTETRSLSLISSFFPRQKLLSAINDSKIGVVVCDRSMRYKALNEIVAEIHNEPIEAHLGRVPQDILGSLAEQVVPLWEEVFVTGRPLLNMEITGHLPKRSGVGRWIQNFFPIKDCKGRVAQVGCFVIEIAPHRTTRIPPAPLKGEGTPLASGPYSEPTPGKLVHLSRREREVIRLVAEGKSNKEISTILAIGVRTVETYRARLMLKLQATSSAQLIHYAIRNQIVTI